jgi:16S rRNA (uracil1498-N3)-methyltransferase
MRRPVAHAFVDDLTRPALADRDFHHFSRVLRLRPGEVVSVSDGRGGSRVCEWHDDALQPLGQPTSEPPPLPALTVGFALTKAEHPRWAVQKLTEAGADRILIMVTDRSVARWPPGSEAHHLERLREVARQAAMQSRRLWLPAVEGPVPFSALAPGETREEGDQVAVAAQGGVPLTLSTPTVLVGPEGGWSDEELAEVPERQRVGLGPNVLRAETAALAAGVLLVALRAGLVRPDVPVAGPVPAGGRARFDPANWRGPVPGNH